MRGLPSGNDRVKHIAGWRRPPISPTYNMRVGEHDESLHRRGVRQTRPVHGAACAGSGLGNESKVSLRSPLHAPIEVGIIVTIEARMYHQGRKKRQVALEAKFPHGRGTVFLAPFLPLLNSADAVEEPTTSAISDSK